MIGVAKNILRTFSLFFKVIEVLNRCIPSSPKSWYTAVDLLTSFLESLPELGPNAGNINRIVIATSFLEEIFISSSLRNYVTLLNHLSSCPFLSQWLWPFPRLLELNFWAKKLLKDLNTVLKPLSSFNLALASEELATLAFSYSFFPFRLLYILWLILYNKFWLICSENLTSQSSGIF